MGGTEKRGGEAKILKRAEQAGSTGGCLKKGRGWNPLTNYAYKEYQIPPFKIICFLDIFIYMSRLFYIDSEITFLESGKTKQY